MVNLEITSELWAKINKLHIAYLGTGDTPQRIEQKKKLEACITDYLSLAQQRFRFSTTRDVLYTSILQNKYDFSPTKFGQAWEMLATYAANLLSQPWRSEFRKIRLHSGAFKQKVEQQLIGAEEILMMMGYTLDIEFDQLIMHGIFDPDRIVEVSRDCMLAKVESQILNEVHVALTVRLGSYSWPELLEYREHHVGSVPQCVRGLLYQHQQRENMMYTMQQPQITPLPSSYTRPPDVYPTTIYQAMGQYNKPYYTNPYHLQHLDQYGVLLPKTLPNYGSGDDETDDSSGVGTKGREHHTTTDWLNGWKTTTLKSVPKFDCNYDMEHLERICSEDYEMVAARRRDDYVAKKSRDERATAPIVSAVVAPVIDVRLGQPAIRDEYGSSRKIPASGGDAAAGRKGLVHKKPHTVIDNKKSTNLKSATLHPATKMKTLGARPKECLPATVRASNQEFEWECQSCTYVNSSDFEVCEMCSKSRHKGPESQPLHQGGRECSKCTLVNQREASICHACGESLNDAPTYI